MAVSGAAGNRSMKLSNLRLMSDAQRISLANSEDRRLVLRLLPRMLRVRIWLMQHDFAVTCDLIRRRGPEPIAGALLADADIWRALRAGRIVNSLGNKLPLDARCLVRSLAAWWLLRSEGVPADLRIGVSLENGFAAHAWVELWGEPLTDTPDILSRFSAFKEVE